METGVRDQSPKLVGQKTFAARNRVPIIPRPLVLSRTHLGTRLILVGGTTRSVINRESVIWAGEPPAQLFLLVNSSQEY